MVVLTLVQDYLETISRELVRKMVEVAVSLVVIQRSAR